MGISTLALSLGILACLAGAAMLLAGLVTTGWSTGGHAYGWTLALGRWPMTDVIRRAMELLALMASLHARTSR